MSCGDECLSFLLAPDLVEAIGDSSAIWRVGAVPPLPELMVLGELAQTAADGSSDVGLDEVGQCSPARFVEAVSGRKTQGRPRPAARPPPRGRSRPVDRRPFGPRHWLDDAAEQAGLSPFHFLRLFAACSA